MNVSIAIETSKRGIQRIPVQASMLEEVFRGDEISSCIIGQVKMQMRLLYRVNDRDCN